jgi:hypothetical protein
MKKCKYFLALFLFGSMSSYGFDARLIDGVEVDKNDYPAIIRIRSGGSSCTATVIGPRVILTAAHCARTNSYVTFQTKGKNYRAKIKRAWFYPYRDHDLAIGITSNTIEGVQPYSIGGKAKVGEKLEIYGYGCTRPGGGGGNDGILRAGSATITGFSGYDMVSKNGAALCFGDSGGPSFHVGQDGQYYVLGVNSKGNIKDTNYNARTDLDKSQSFFENSTRYYKIDICGINLNC